MARVTFGPYVFDSVRRLLLRGGNRVHLTRKAFLFLEFLLQNRPAVLSKSQIMAHLWPDCFVSEDSVATLISEIRTALGPEGRSYIRTVHGVGYAFAAEEILAPATPDIANPARFVLIEKGPHPRLIGLMDGATVIGRGMSCDIRVNSNTVSRTHARIRLVQDTAVLEDLGSRNGTYLRGSRLKGPVDLKNGDEIRLGAVEMIFRTAISSEGETDPVD